MELKGIKFAPNATFEMVVADGFSHCEPGEGFDYIVGRVAGGELKVVFDPYSPDFSSNIINGVDGFGYILAFEDKEGDAKVVPESDAPENPEVELHGQWFPADQVPAHTDRRQRQPAGQPAAAAVAPSVTGYVSYDVRVTCPHCERKLALNQTPYNDESEYSPAEDDLGLALFGTNQKPATWDGLAIEYTCCACQQTFMVSSLEI